MVKSSARYPQGLPRLGDMLVPEANSFGALRLAMAVLVVISHSYFYTFGSTAAEPITAWTGHSLGEHAVQVFFILSGILVAQSFERSRSLMDFAAARVLRIFPALIVCVLLTALVIGPVVSHFSIREYFASSVLPAYILKTLSLSTGSAHLPGVFKGLPVSENVNMSLWTLKYEVLCYVGLACAGAAGLFRPRWRFCAATTVALFTAVIFAAEPKDIDTYAFGDNLRYFSVYFGTGVLAYLVRDQLVIAGAALVPLAILFIVALGTRFAELSTALLFCYAAIWAASKSIGRLRMICNRVDMSFGVYIYAGPIQQGMIEYAPPLHPLIAAVLVGLVVVPLAFVSWVINERPALLLRRRLQPLLVKASDTAGTVHC